MNAIFTRRSIRAYRKDPVAEETVSQILKAGMHAPSAGDEQPWHFIVISDRALLRAITKIHPYAEMLDEAPVAILVCADLALQKYEGYWVQDCAAATENMLIQATDMGLGGVWLGVHPVEERVAGLKKLFGLPEAVRPFSLISLGYPAEDKPPKDIFRKERVHRNGWGHPFRVD